MTPEQVEKRRAANRAWAKTPSGKASQKRYQKTTGYKEKRKLWLASPAGRAAQNRSRLLCKKNVINHYGGQCRCCNTTEIEFLTLDHIHDDGAEQRRSYGKIVGGAIYRYIKNTPFEERPKDLQVLCFNCQWGKRVGKGFCPHHPKVDLRLSIL